MHDDDNHSWMWIKGWLLRRWGTTAIMVRFKYLHSRAIFPSSTHSVNPAEIKLQILKHSLIAPPAFVILCFLLRLSASVFPTWRPVEGKTKYQVFRILISVCGTSITVLLVTSREERQRIVNPAPPRSTVLSKESPQIVVLKIQTTGALFVLWTATRNWGDLWFNLKFETDFGAVHYIFRNRRVKINLKVPLGGRILPSRCKKP